MILRYPAYYEKFHCIAGECEDTCCAGWEIDIDDESYRFYQSVPGDFGRRLRESIREYESGEEGAYESHGFILGEDRRCPFLNGENLCNLYRELGEESLCNVCADTPRNYFEYGGAREIAVSASCPEAGRLIYRSRDKIVFVEKEIEGELDFEESRGEILLAQSVCRARNEAVRILQERRMPLCDRISAFLHYAESVQSCLNRNEPEAIDGIVLPDCGCDQMGAPDREGEPADHGLLLGRLMTFTSMESIRGDWEEMLELMEKYFVSPENGDERYREAQRRWLAFLKEEDREYEYEHLLVYYAFMCLPRCVDDYDFLRQAKFVVVSFLMLRDMDSVWFAEKGRYEVEDRERMARIYAREVEHSQDNLNILTEDILFEEAYTVENLCRSAGAAKRGSE